jgi:hypothetical protein
MKMSKTRYCTDFKYVENYLFWVTFSKNYKSFCIFWYPFELLKSFFLGLRTFYCNFEAKALKKARKWKNVFYNKTFILQPSEG